MPDTLFNLRLPHSSVEPAIKAAPVAAIVGTRYVDYDPELTALEGVGAGVRVCADPANALEATLVLGSSSPVYSAAVLERMPNCRAIIRYGVGVAPRGLVQRAS